MTRRTKDVKDITSVWGKLDKAGAGVALNPWSGVDADKIARMVVAVTACGSAALFGTTSDGGAGTILIFADGQKKRLYGADEAALDSALGIIIEWAEDRA